MRTKNAKRNFLTIKSAKAIFGILRFRPRNQALEAPGTQGGQFLEEPRPAPTRAEPPVTLEPSKNPFRQSLIGEKVIKFQASLHGNKSHAQESSEIQFLRKLIFAIPPMQNACFSNPRHPDSNPKITRKSNLGTSMNKHTFLRPRHLKSSQNGVPQSTKNY